MGTNSTLGVRTPEARNFVVYVRMCTFGNAVVAEEEDSTNEAEVTDARGLELVDSVFEVERKVVVVASFRDAGVGPTEILMTCSSPRRDIESTSSPLKKSSSIDFR